MSAVRTKLAKCGKLEQLQQQLAMFSKEKAKQKEAKKQLDKTGKLDDLQTQLAEFDKDKAKLSEIKKKRDQVSIPTAKSG